MRKENNILRVGGVLAIGAGALLSSRCGGEGVVKKVSEGLNSSGANGARNSLIVGGGIGSGGFEDGSGGGTSGNPNEGDDETQKSGGIRRGLQPYVDIAGEVADIIENATSIDPKHWE